MALIILGVKKNDTVLCSSLTFAASANAILYQGARPVFIDSDPSTWTVDVASIEKAIKSICFFNYMALDSLRQPQTDSLRQPTNCKENEKTKVEQNIVILIKFK